MKKDKYTGYAAADFLQDSYFQQWLQNPTAEVKQFWEFWLQEHPGQLTEIMEAKAVYAAMNFDYNLPEHKIEALKWSIDSRIASLENKAAAEKQPPLRPLFGQKASYSTWYRVAASLTGLLLVSACLVYLFLANQVITVQTAAGEIRTVVLPDSSRVTLNSHSAVTYPAYWHLALGRAVEMKGEAFFAVTHQPDNQKFTVKTASGFEVEVLGTEFNVTDRDKKKRIILQSGQVKVHVPAAESQPAAHVLMQPDELVDLTKRGSKLSSRKVNVAPYLAWRQKRLNFSAVPMPDIIVLLEETYGYTVEVLDPQVLDQRISGSMVTDRIDLFLTGIAKVNKLEIKTAGDTIFISRQ